MYYNMYIYFLIIDFMQTLTATQLRKEIFKVPEKLDSTNDLIRVSYKSGKNIILIDEQEYNNLLEHLHILKDKTTMDKIKNQNNLEYETFNSINDLDNAI